MKITENISFQNFKSKKKNSKISSLLKSLLEDNNEILNSLTKNYKNNFDKNLITNLKKFSNIQLIGMGGSILGAKSIYSFLRKKVKRNFSFKDSFSGFSKKGESKKKLNIIISKSGNTLETIANTNILIKKNQKNIFITENKNSYLLNQAKKLKAEIIHHNNYIGGRYSVLSEVGMLPAELMGFKQHKFKRLNNIIKNKNFLNSLIHNVSNILKLVKNKKNNSIIINYDENASDFFKWYQQLVAESLGKKGKGILPLISSMPKDNHSLMQYFLDGYKNNFFTFFFTEEKLSPKINNSELFQTHFYLKNKNLNDIAHSQFEATLRVFRKRNIPFRSFLIKKRNEETLGELFTFFILETILLGKSLNVNPYDQPSVELIKLDTKKILMGS